MYHYFYRTASALKGHITRTHKVRSYHGSTADKDTRVQLHVKAQDEKPHVQCGTKQIDNVWRFKYLGSWLRADGDQIVDVKAKIVTTVSTAGKMRAIWESKSIPLRLKMRIYKTGVCSRLTYGADAWRLDPRTCATLNGANSRMVARITNRTPHEEASAETRTFDVVRWIRARRLQWVGHILRMDPHRMVQQAARHIHENRSTGDLLMDVPPKLTWEELRSLASNRDGWRDRVRSLREGPRVQIIMTTTTSTTTATSSSVTTTTAPTANDNTTTTTTNNLSLIHI